MKLEIKLSEALYYLFFVLLFTTRILGLYEGNIVYSAVFVIGALCFLVSYLLTPETIKAYFFDAVLLLLAFISWRLSGEKGLILYFMMMIGTRRIALVRLFKVVLLISGTAYSFMIMLGAFGIINEFQNSVEYRSIFGYVNRRTISPLQLNIFMEPYLVLMIMALFLIKDKGKKATLWVSGILLIGLLYLFGYCFTYSTFGIGLMILVVSYYLKFYGKYSFFTESLSHFIYFFIVLIATVVPYLDNGKLGDGNTLARRFQIGHYYWQNNMPSLFGQRLLNPNPADVPYVIHQSQLYLLLQYGVILFLVVNFLHHLAIHKMIKEKDGVALASLLSFAVLGIMEPFLFNLSFKNIVFVFVGKAYGALLENGKKGAIQKKTIQLIPDRTFDIRVSVFEDLLIKIQLMVVSIRKRIVLISMILGCLMAFVAALQTPDVEYVYDQKAEKSVDGIQYMFTPQDISNITEQGISVVINSGYGHPFYKHVSYVPIYDYMRLIISSFMWTTIWSFIILALLSKTDKGCYHIGDNNI